jgi:hypothetical protein
MTLDEYDNLRRKRAAAMASEANSNFLNQIGGAFPPKVDI